MISVSEAEKIILDQAAQSRLHHEIVALKNAYGRVLSEPIKADRDQPAFDKSTMDGMAIHSKAWAAGEREFRLEGIAAAGRKPLRLKNSNGCIHIMTGGALPEGCDCVVPIEQVRIDGKSVKISAGHVKAGQFIRYQGADGRRGDPALDAGIQLRAPQIAAAASAGKSRIRVKAKLRAAIISTGDEIVSVDRKKIKPYEVRASNSFALDAMLTLTHLCQTEMFHIKDNPKVLKSEIKKILNRFDLVILSGGVSMGKFDFIPRVLDELGVEVLFHKVSQKPGKPFWFGKNKNGKVVFALPGNPVSTQICAYRYLIPYLHKAFGLAYNDCRSILTRDVNAIVDLTSFVPVKIRLNSHGLITASPLPNGGSGDYGTLARADGFVELKSGQNKFTQGSIVPFYSW